MTKNENTKRLDKSAQAGREFIERGLWRAEEATKGAQQSFSSSVANMREPNITVIEMAHANTDALFDLAHEIASAQAPSDLAAILSAHARRQFQMMTKQTQELTELGQKLAGQNGKLLTGSVTRGE